MQSVEILPPEGSVERLARFAQLQPDNALANYYYAVSLWKQSGKQSAGPTDAEGDNEHSARVEALLQKAVRISIQSSALHICNLGFSIHNAGIFRAQFPRIKRQSKSVQKLLVSPGSATR